MRSALRTVVLRAIAMGHAGVILSLASSFPATSTLVPLKASALHRWKLWDTAAQPAPLPRASPSVHRPRGGRVAADTFETSVLPVLLEREPLPDSVPTAQVIRASALRILAVFMRSWLLFTGPKSKTWTMNADTCIFLKWEFISHHRIIQLESPELFCSSILENRTSELIQKH